MGFFDKLFGKKEEPQVSNDSETSTEESPETETQDEADEEKVKERLKGLGYL